MEQDTKQKILDASKILFYKNGYSNTSVRQIADFIGISNSVLFHHFVNKKDILAHIMNEYRDNIKKVFDLFYKDLSPIDRVLLNPKIQLHSALNDAKFARIIADAFNEHIFTSAAASSLNALPLQLYMDATEYKEKSYSIEEMIEFRYYCYRGAIKEVMSNFVNGVVPFNKKSIDHYLVSCYNLFFNIPIDTLSDSIKRVDRIISLLTFDGFNIYILNDKISKYISVDKEYRFFDNYKVILINNIVFYDEKMTVGMKEINKDVEWLKENFNKVIILVKNYKLEDPVDTKGILSSLNDFKEHIINSYSVLINEFEKNFFVTSFIDENESDKYNGILNNFKSYGIDAMKTIRSINMHYAGDDSVVSQVAFIFYK